MSILNAAQHPFVFIGNWDRHKSSPKNGFGICKFDSEAGSLCLVGSAAPQITVGAACLDSQRSILYCSDEYTTLPGYFLGGGGQLYAFRINPQTGALTEFCHGPSFGSLPSSLSLDATGKYLIATHHTDRTPVTKVLQDPTGRYRISLDYDDATTVLFPLSDDGQIGEPCNLFKHSGSGGPLARQTHPQLHSVTRSPSGNMFLVCDKGNDELLCFRIDYEAARLTLCCEAVKTSPGSSPRYSAFHPSQPFVFVNHETKALVSAFHYDDSGTISLVCTASALPSGWQDSLRIKQSDIQVHPDGKSLYSLVRGLDVVALFDIEENTGVIQLVDTVELDGTGPRACAISPDGRFMLIAALDSREVLIWKIREDGSLIPTGHKITQPNPGTVTFFTPGS